MLKCLNSSCKRCIRTLDQFGEQYTKHTSTIGRWTNDTKIKINVYWIRVIHKWAVNPNKRIKIIEARDRERKRKEEREKENTCRTLFDVLTHGKSKKQNFYRYTLHELFYRLFFSFIRFFSLPPYNSCKYVNIYEVLA